MRNLQTYLMVFILSLFSGLLSSQPLLNLVDTSYGGGAGGEVYVEDSTYVVFASNGAKWNKIDYVRLTYSGNVVNQFSALYDSTNVIYECWGCLDKVRGKYYWAFISVEGSQTVQGRDSVYATIQRVNSSLKVEKEKTIFYSLGGLPSIRTLSFDSDSTFIVAGYIFRTLPSVYKYDLWVAKFDTAFNIIWEKSFTDKCPNRLQGYRGTDIVVDNYGSILVTGEGTCYTPGFNDVMDRVALMARLDAATGDLYWLKEFKGPDGSHTVMALDRGDGSYRFVETQILWQGAKNLVINSTRLRHGVIDTTGKVQPQYNKVEDSINGNFYIQDMYCTLDSNYYVAGHRSRDTVQFQSAGYKFTPAGDSLWYREYYHQDPRDYSKIWSFKPTPDSGFVHLGTWADIHNPQTQDVHTWLLKTDKYGCYVQGCHEVGLGELLPPPVFSVYPNPTSGRLWIEREKRGSANLEIISAEGRLLLEYHIQHTTAEINLKDFATGMYLLKLTDEEGAAAIQKIMIH